MVHIQALKNLEKAEQVAVTVGHTHSSIITTSMVQYADALKIASPILEKKKRRIQITNILNSDLPIVFPFIKRTWINRGEIKVIIDARDLERYTFLKSENLIFRSEYDQSVAIVKACNFFLCNIRDEAYTLNDNDCMEYLHPKHTFYPYILIILDFKMRFYKVDSANSFQRFCEGDISLYKNQLRLVPENFCQIVSLAKFAHYQVPCSSEQRKSAKGLLQMLCKNIGQLCKIYTANFNINQVLIADCINGEEFFKRILNESIWKYANYGIKTTFLRHEKLLHGFNGLDSFDEIAGNAWAENYCESTGLVTQACLLEGIKSAQLTLDSLDHPVTFCPLLSNPLNYYPDIQNLSQDSSAREYWLNCIAEGVKQATERMTLTVESEAVKNINQYKDLVVKRLIFLKTNHQIYGNLSMRLLQDTLESIKREMGLVTMYEKRKKDENETALKELGERLKYLDSLNYSELQKELIKSLLAGNLFDWGAKEVAKLLSTGGFNFQEAINKLPERPWLIDDLNDWIKRCEEHTYTSVMVFVDNSGYDIIIGILPFIREFLKKGAKVFVCVNTEPILNDVTSYELKQIFEEIKSICPILKQGIEEKALIILEMVKSSCCLDLSFIDVKIANVMETIDLLVIEGMGRAVHTNLNAIFKCDSLRLAVIKDDWLSKKLGGDRFACICKFTRGGNK